MKFLRIHLPSAVTLSCIAIALWYGPVPQLANYHDFADHSHALGIPHCMDVLSNLGFAIVALWGIWHLFPVRQHHAIRHGFPGYALFLTSLFFTAIGSSYYHLAPDNARLVWDRLPIALACAGLLAGVWGDVWTRSSKILTLMLSTLALSSVVWWHYTEQAGAGDLRPYLLLQGLPLILIPLWQKIHHAPRAERLAFAGAVGCYVLAKLAELADHPIAVLTGFISGHSLKHLLASLAAALIVARLLRRTQQSETLQKSAHHSFTHPTQQGHSSC